MNDILLGTCCHFLHCLIFNFLYPNATTRDSVNFQTNSGSSFRSMPLARKPLLSDLLSNLFPVSTGILPHSLPEWAFRARPGLWRNCLCPKVARIAEQKFGSR